MLATQGHLALFVRFAHAEGLTVELAHKLRRTPCVREVHECVAKVPLCVIRSPFPAARRDVNGVVRAMKTKVVEDARHVGLRVSTRDISDHQRGALLAGQIIISA